MLASLNTDDYLCPPLQDLFCLLICLFVQWHKWTKVQWHLLSKLLACCINHCANWCRDRNVATGKKAKEWGLKMVDKGLSTKTIWRWGSFETFPFCPGGGFLTRTEKLSYQERKFNFLHFFLKTQISFADFPVHSWKEPEARTPLRRQPSGWRHNTKGHCHPRASSAKTRGFHYMTSTMPSEA